MNDLVVFAYGSLMFEPEAEAALAWRARAVLHGHVRVLNKRSPPRGCRHDEALIRAALPGWSSDTGRISLAMGTEAVHGGQIVGEVLAWPAQVADAVSARLDRREGWVDGAPRSEQAYLREIVALETPRGNLMARAYLANPTGPYHVLRLGIDRVAAVLAHATPREPGPRARGVDYAIGTVRSLRRLGGEDPVLEAIVEASARWLGKARVEC